MSYPTIVLILALFAASFMLFFIVPGFVQMFEDLGGTLPLPTRVALGPSDMLTSTFGVLVYVGMGLGVFLFLRWKRRRMAGRFGDGWC
jgi:type IV pilus assembly protein PilC